MTLYIERHRAEQALEELTPIIRSKVDAELQVVHVSMGYGIQVRLKYPPSPRFEWFAVYRGIPVIYDHEGCDLS